MIIVKQSKYLMKIKTLGDDTWKGKVVNTNKHYQDWTKFVLNENNILLEKDKQNNYNDYA